MIMNRAPAWKFNFYRTAVTYFISSHGLIKIVIFIEWSSIINYLKSLKITDIYTNYL